LKAALTGVLGLTVVSAESVRFSLVDPAAVEHRLDRVTSDSARRLSALGELFIEAGCRNNNLTWQIVKGAKTPNVICTLPGETDDAILVGAHYDMTGPDTGAVDNWTGTTMLANLHDALRHEKRRHTIRFIGFADEEKGLVGSRFHAQKMSKEELARLRIMINIDSIGMGPVNVWHSRSDPRLISALRQIEAALQLSIAWVDVDRVGNSDSYSLARRRIPVIDFHSLTQETLLILHSPKDTIDAINKQEYQRTYRALAAYLAFLDGRLEEILARQIKKK
jgi:Iap family predicted aminopeptidase